MSVYGRDGLASSVIIDSAGDVGIRDIRTEYALANVVSREGSFTSASVEVNRSTIVLEAGRDITTGTEHIEGSDVTAFSREGGFTAAVVDIGSSTVVLDICMDIETGNETVKDSNVTATSREGGFTAGIMDISGSAFTLETRTDIVTSDEFINGSAVTATSRKGGFTSGDISAVSSSVEIIAAEDGRIPEIRAYGSDISMDMGRDLRFDNAIIRKTHMSLSAGKTLGMRDGGGNDCSEYGRHAFIQIDRDDTDADSSLALTGKESIGERNSTLIVDIPESITLLVPQAGDMFIESLELIPEICGPSGTFEEVRVSESDPGLGLDRVSHPDNPKINEFSGTEVDTKEDISGDWLSHITDEVKAEDLPWKTSEELAQSLMTLMGESWLTIVNDEAVIKLIEDAVAGKGYTDLLTDDEIADMIRLLCHNETVPCDADRQLAAWIIMNTEAYPELRKRLEEGGELSDSEILEVTAGYQPSEEKAKADLRQEKIRIISETKDESGVSIGAAAIWNTVKTCDSPDDSTTLLVMLLDSQTAENGSEDIIPGITGLIEKMLTAEELSAIRQKAVGETEVPEEARNGYAGEEPKAFNVEIGRASGSINIYNNGDINIEVTGESDLKAEYIRSERGDVTVIVRNGSLEGTGSENENILGGNISLAVSENIGAGESIRIQQRDSVPTVAVNPADPGSIDDPKLIGRNEDGSWTYGVTLSYDWMLKDVEDAIKRLDAEAENGSVSIIEMEGGTGIGIISAGENITLITDGSFSDVRTDAEKAAGRNNITSAGDTAVMAHNGAVGAEERPITVSVRGQMTAESKDDIKVMSPDDLAITADSQDGTVTVSSERDLSVANTVNAAHGTGDITLYATAGKNAAVDVRGEIRDGSVITAGEDAYVSSGSGITETTVTAGGNADVRTGGDIAGTHISASGSAYAGAEGSIVNGRSGTEVTADDVTVRADTDADGYGTVGAKDSPVTVDTSSGATGKGTLTAYGTNVYIRESSGNLVIDRFVTTEGEAVITAPGKVTDRNAESLFKDAEEAWKQAFDADNAADSAEDKAEILEEEADRLEKTARKAEEEAAKAAEEALKARHKAEEAAKALADAQIRITEIEEEIERLRKEEGLSDEEKKENEEKILALEEQKKMLEGSLDSLRKTADETVRTAEALEKTADEKAVPAAEARRLADEARRIADEAIEDARSKRAAAEEARVRANELEEKAYQAETSVVTAGDLTIFAGDDVGAYENRLDLNVGGSLTVGTPGDLYIFSEGVLHIADLDADGNADTSRDVYLTAGGDIISDKVITGGRVAVSTYAGGNAGTANRPLALRTKILEGSVDGDAFITNAGSLTVDDLTVIGRLELSAAGSILTGKAAEGTANITAEKAEIRADGNVGSAGRPLVTAVDSITVNADDVYIRSIKDLEIDRIEAENVFIDVEGKTVAGPSQINITADNLTLNSYGGVGTAAHPLVVDVSGNVTISNVYGEQHSVNVYVPPYYYHHYPTDETETEPEEMKPETKPGNKPSGNGTKPGGKEDGEGSAWALTNLILMFFNIMMALILLWIFIRKKRSNRTERSDFLGLTGLVPAAASAILYLVTEDMGGVMKAADKWTALMLLFFSAEAALMYLMFRGRNDG